MSDDPLNERLIKLLCCIQGTCEDELDPAGWDSQAAQVAEVLLRGGEIAPDLQHYLNNAPDCQEEFYALMAILRAEQAMKIISDGN